MPISQAGDLTSGNIPRNMLRFSLPILLGNLIQNGYSVVNTIWIGQLVGENGVGVTAVVNSVVMLLITIAVGITSAAGLIISRLTGAGDPVPLNKSVRQTLTITLLVGLFLTFASIMMSDWLLVVLKTPEEILSLASGFLKLSLSGFFMLFLSVVVMTIMRGTGDSVTPMFFTLFAVILNAILDPLLMMGISFFPELGLMGAAWASLLSQGAACAGSLLYLRKKQPGFWPGIRDFWPDSKLVLELAKIGIPFTMQHAIVALGGMFITADVNRFGVHATNAFGATGRLETLIIMPAQSFGVAISMMVSQNIGAKAYHRIRALTGWGIFFTVAMTIVLSLLAIVFATPILTAFGLLPLSAEAAIAVRYIWIVATCYPVMALFFALSGTINGTGNTFYSMLVAAISLWGIRIPLTGVLSQSLQTDGIWIATSIGFFSSAILGVYFYWLKCIRPYKNLKPQLNFDVSNP